jgi:copper resistance protein B
MTRALGLLITLALSSSAPLAHAQTTPAPHDHQSATPPAATGAAAALPAFIRPLTDADRAVAFPDVGYHAMLDNRVNYFVLADHLELPSGDDGVRWDTTGWVGTDLDRLWFRFGGDSRRSRLESARTELLYGRSISRWWTAVAGVRQDVRPGSPQTWAAVGLQGLAPYWFAVEATAYVGAGGRTHVRVETEYDLLVTNRLILQPVVELDAYGKADAARHGGAGLSEVDAGVRLRYEFKREFAPYVGVTWSRALFGTGDLRRAVGESVGQRRLVVGLRLWL